MTNFRPGLLISFDGVDSSGKETQTKLLVDRLQRQGYVVHQFQTPDYTTPSGQDLKRRLQNKDGTWEQTSWEEKMRLFAANRREHREEVLAALKRGEMVVYDRYVPSSLAFMAIEALSGSKAALDRQQIHEAVEYEEYGQNQMPNEHLSIFLDVPPDISNRLLHKRKERLQEDDEYTDRLDVQRQLYNEYDYMCVNNLKRFARIKCIVGGEILGIPEVSELVWEAMLVNFPYLKDHA